MFVCVCVCVIEIVQIGAKEPRRVTILQEFSNLSVSLNVMYTFASLPRLVCADKHTCTENMWSN